MIRLEFAAVCRSCEVPTRGQLTVFDGRVGGVVGGRLDGFGWTCDTCAQRLDRLAVGDGAR